MKWSVAVLSWVLFFVGLGLELGIDYYLRMVDGDPKTGGMAPILYYGIQLLLLVVAVILAFIGCQKISVLTYRVLIVAVQGVLGFGVYLCILLYYVFEFGIDSM